jgi:hypothetical protein
MCFHFPCSIFPVFTFHFSISFLIFQFLFFHFPYENFYMKKMRGSEHFFPNSHKPYFFMDTMQKQTTFNWEKFFHFHTNFLKKCNFLKNDFFKNRQSLHKYIFKNKLFNLFLIQQKKVHQNPFSGSRELNF